MAKGFADAREAQAAREAADWHSRVVEGLTPSDRASFDLWRAEPGHAQAYAEIERIAALAQQLPAPVRRRKAAQSPRLQPIIIAASLALLVGAGAIFTNLGGGTRAEAALTNPGPAVRMVRLDDGSVITLDVGAQLALSSRDGRQVAKLRAGRARFEAGPSSTLIVQANTEQLRLVRGQLDLWWRGANAYATLLSGRAGLTQTAMKGSTPLAVGLSINVDTSGEGQFSAAGQVDRHWPLARVQVVDTALDTILARANAVSKAKVVVDSSVRKLRVTGVLDLRDARTLSLKLAAAHRLRLVALRDRLLLTR